MTIERVSLCTVKGCPEPKNPDFHIPICGHGLAGSHHHVMKRSQGGKDGPQVFICPDCHNEIDNGLWGNAIMDIPGVGKVYRVWTLKNETVFERVLEGSSSVAEPDNRIEHPLHTVADTSSATEPHASERVIGESAAAEAEGISRAPGRTLPKVDKISGSVAAPSSLTHEQRINIAASIRTDQQQRQWVAGDTANEWVTELGEEAWQYLDEFGYTHMSLSNIMHVCEAIPPPLRDGRLPYSFHVVVYRLNKEDIEMWLGHAEEMKLTVRELRAQVHGEPPRAKKKWTLEELRKQASAYDRPQTPVDGAAVMPSGIWQFLDWLEASR